MCLATEVMSYSALRSDSSFESSTNRARESSELVTRELCPFPEVSSNSKTSVGENILFSPSLTSTSHSPLITTNRLRPVDWCHSPCQPAGPPRNAARTAPPNSDSHSGGDDGAKGVSHSSTSTSSKCDSPFESR